MGDRVLMALRQQAWQRAKAELRSVLVTIWDEGPPSTWDKHEKFSNVVNEFIKKVEDEGWQE